MASMNVSFEGYSENVLEKMIKCGYAKTKAEALRLALFEFDQRYLLKNEEELFREAAHIMLKEVEEGKEKTSKFSLTELD